MNHTWLALWGSPTKTKVRVALMWLYFLSGFLRDTVGYVINKMARVSKKTVAWRWEKEKAQISVSLVYNWTFTNDMFAEPCAIHLVAVSDDMRWLACSDCTKTVNVFNLKKMKVCQPWERSLKRKAKCKSPSIPESFVVYSLVCLIVSLSLSLSFCFLYLSCFLQWVTQAFPKAICYLDLKWK